MQISKGTEIMDLCLKKDKTLIIADIHMGFEEALGKQGIMVPALQYKDTVKRLTPILQKAKPETVVINGDLKHEFGTISDTEWRNTLKLLELISKHCKNIILIRGNHDTLLGPIAKKINIEVKDHHVIDDTYICHGHELPNDKDYKQAKKIIIGHEHPAISLTKDGRTETFKCFLKGTYKGKKLIVMPSFNLLTEGSNVLREEILSPFLKQDMKSFEVYIIGEKTYYFGQLKNLEE